MWIVCSPRELAAACTCLNSTSTLAGLFVGLTSTAMVVVVGTSSRSTSTRFGVISVFKVVMPGPLVSVDTYRNDMRMPHAPGFYFPPRSGLASALRPILKGWTHGNVNKAGRALRQWTEHAATAR